VIVKGIAGTKITACKALLMISFCFVYSTAICSVPFLGLWSKFCLEGFLISCSFDYVTDTAENKAFVLSLATCCFAVPLCFVLYFYSQIVCAVVSHERALKAQAKKMNVASLRANESQNAESAEVRIARVAVTNVGLWLLAWSPYGAVAVTSQLAGISILTPVIVQFPSMLAKVASCLNPIVYAVSHPKFREALDTEFPFLGIKESSSSTSANEKSETVKTVAESA